MEHHLIDRPLPRSLSRAGRIAAAVVLTAAAGAAVAAGAGASPAAAATTLAVNANPIGTETPFGPRTIRNTASCKRS